MGMDSCCVQEGSLLPSGVIPQIISKSSSFNSLSLMSLKGSIRVPLDLLYFIFAFFMGACQYK